MEQYIEMGVVGEGAFGRVTKIKRVSDNEVLCWKEIHFGSMSEREKQMLVAEVNVMRELCDHPNIVRYHDRVIDRQRKVIYIVMEYCSGGDLASAIKLQQVQNTYFEEEFVWSILQQIGSALRVCHSRPDGAILHRDLKPGNILLDADHSTAKLTDFGLARVLTETNQFARSHVGTPSYMSPEQVREGRYNEKCDIWSLGCLLYEVACLAPPFRASNQLALAKKISMGKFPEIPAHYTPFLRELIKSMLDLRPHYRPSIEDILDTCTRRHSTPSLVDRRIEVRERRLQEREAELESWAATLEARERVLVQREQRLQQVSKSLLNQSSPLPLRRYDADERSEETHMFYKSPRSSRDQDFITPKSRRTESFTGHLHSGGDPCLTVEEQRRYETLARLNRRLSISPIK